MTGACLHRATQGGRGVKKESSHKAIKWVLRNSNIAVNSTSYNGWTPLMNSLRAGDEAAAKLLVELDGNSPHEDEQRHHTCDRRSC